MNQHVTAQFGVPVARPASESTVTIIANLFGARVPAHLEERAAEVIRATVRKEGHMGAIPNPFDRTSFATHGGRSPAQLARVAARRALVVKLHGRGKTSRETAAELTEITGLPVTYSMVEDDMAKLRLSRKIPKKGRGK